tara:strand:- start:290 stop:493 length:204 start_codon:yes stop_codon:yes gene_type:complete
VKKLYQDKNLKTLDVALTENLETKKNTNVNILLNRVRLDKRKTLLKRIIFSLAIIVFVSSLAFYFVI